MRITWSRLTATESSHLISRYKPKCRIEPGLDSIVPQSSATPQTESSATQQRLWVDILGSLCRQTTYLAVSCDRIRRRPTETFCRYIGLFVRINHVIWPWAVTESGADQQRHFADISGSLCEYITWSRRRPRRNPAPTTHTMQSTARRGLAKKSQKSARCKIDYIQWL